MRKEKFIADLLYFLLELTENDMKKNIDTIVADL
jgi:hypothetical protein